MFTGIIEALGQVREQRRSQQDIRLTIDTARLDMSDVHLGDSIAVNGVCLTVVDFSPRHFCADVSHETLERSSLGQLKKGHHVNLEKAMAAQGRFGGHMVSGHVDGLATVESITEQGQTIDIWLSYPPELGRYIAEKGSITVDGISLTVNELAANRFRLTIIPHTLHETTIEGWKRGSRVNLEVDVIARYLERLFMSTPSAHAVEAKTSGLTQDKLAQYGFIKN